MLVIGDIFKVRYGEYVRIGIIVYFEQSCIFPTRTEVKLRTSDSKGIHSFSYYYDDQLISMEIK